MDIRVREDILLTVHDVAQILKVPSSWVYEHTRERCRDRISRHPYRGILAVPRKRRTRLAGRQTHK